MDALPPTIVPRWSRLSFLLSTLILFTALLDLALRRLPVSRVAFRAWEVSRLNRTSLGPFGPNLTFYNPLAYGDLANLGNLPQYRVYRPERFSTDALGFRNTPQTAGNGPIRIVLLGDSFMAGAALSDDQTFAAHLAAQTGVRNFNAAGKIEWDAVAELLARFHVQGATVLLEITEVGFTDNLSLPSTSPGSWPVRALRGMLPQEQYRDIRALGRSASRWYQYSPLRIYCTRAFRILQNDRWLPNPGAAQVLPGELGNGHRMLFLVNRMNLPDIVPADVEYFVRVRDLVRQTGNELLVAMVPDKYRVYCRFLKPPAGSPRSTSGFQNLLPALAKAGIPSVDLSPVLSEQAVRLYPAGQYNYRDDDSHWNPVGVHRASEAVAAAWRELP